MNNSRHLPNKMAASAVISRCSLLSRVPSHHNVGFLSQLLPCIIDKRHNSNSTSVTRPRRTCYTRTYPTMVIFPDGSTTHIRYREPRKIIKLPLDFSQLSAEEKRIVLANRKPKEKLEEEDVFQDTFDADEYTKYWKK